MNEKISRNHGGASAGPGGSGLRGVGGRRGDAEGSSYTGGSSLEPSAAGDDRIPKDRFRRQGADCILYQGGKYRRHHGGGCCFIGQHQYTGRLGGR